jgi:hypothetical protein
MEEGDVPECPNHPYGAATKYSYPFQAFWIDHVPPIYLFHALKCLFGVVQNSAGMGVSVRSLSIFGAY